MAREGTRSSVGPLLARLAVDHPRLVKRDALISSLYPDASPTDARNRLRVALTRLRRGIALKEVGDEVGLDPDLTEVDLHRVRSRLAELGLEPDAAAEVNGLAELAESLSATLFPGTGSEWEMQAQLDWSQVAAEALGRLGDLAENTIDFRNAALAAEGCLRHFPEDGRQWERYLGSMARLGRREEAARTLALARRRARTEGWELPEEALAWSPEDDHGAGPELSPGESHALGSFFRRVLVENPLLAVEMLGSPSFRPEVLSHPGAVLPLLRQALRSDTPPSEARERVQVRVITALALLERNLEVIKEGEELLRQPIGKARRRVTLLSLSFARALEGDFPRALADIDESMDLAQGLELAECRAQRAALLLMQGEMAEAERECRIALDSIETPGSMGAERDVLVIRGNLGLCLIHQDRLAEGVSVLEPVVERARALGANDSVGLFGAALGLGWARAGRPAGRILIEALRSAYRTSQRRGAEAAGYASRALMAAGHEAEGRSLMAEAGACLVYSARQTNALDRAVFLEESLRVPSSPGRPLVEVVRSLIAACSRAWP